MKVSDTVCIYCICKPIFTCDFFFRPVIVSCQKIHQKHVLTTNFSKSVMFSTVIYFLFSMFYCKYILENLLSTDMKRVEFKLHFIDFFSVLVLYYYIAILIITNSYYVQYIRVSNAVLKEGSSLNIVFIKENNVITLNKISKIFRYITYLTPALLFLLSTTEKIICNSTYYLTRLHFSVALYILLGSFLQLLVQVKVYKICLNNQSHQINLLLQAENKNSNIYFTRRIKEYNNANTCLYYNLHVIMKHIQYVVPIGIVFLLILFICYINMFLDILYFKQEISTDTLRHILFISLCGVFLIPGFFWALTYVTSMQVKVSKI